MTKRFHFIAIGGAVMHNLALELLAHGHIITGSDDEIFDPAKSRLLQAGILPEKLGWFQENVQPNLDGIILGMHAKADNPELLKAKELGLKVYSFPEYIFEHSKNKKRVVIGGSHGKTTCTAMLMHVLKFHKVDFDYLVGSQLQGFDRMVKLSDAPLIIIEGDEYLTSALDPVPKFHRYLPHLAMITGVAWDHINVFPTYENYVNQFKIFINTIQKDGKLYWYKNDTDLLEIAIEAHVFNRSYDCPAFKTSEPGVVVEIEGSKYPLQIFGKHNLENAMGVSLLAADLGINTGMFWTAMCTFTGTAKRLEKVYETEDIVVFRDFAHAPSKVKATVQAVREQYPTRDFLALFELHTFSSLRADFMPQYKGSLDPADAAFVLFDPHVYALKNMPIPNHTEIEGKIGSCLAFNNSTELLTAWMERFHTGNKQKVLLLMSSGNLGGISTDDFYK